MKFQELYQAVRAKGDNGAFRLPTRLLALDPGETTGVSLFEGLELRLVDQINTSHMNKAPLAVRDLLIRTVPTDIVMELYRIYQWKKNEHTWAALHTPRLIGCVETFSLVPPFKTPGDPQGKIPLWQQTAQVAKGFCTDEKLKEWGFWTSGKKHGNDALRHACYFLLFNKGVYEGG